MNDQTIPPHFFRHEYGRLVAVLSRRLGRRHLEAIEDAVQSALLKAVESWKLAPLPENPAAWLYQVAANKLVGDLRQESSRRAILRRHAPTAFPASALDPVHISPAGIADDLLRLLVFCCDQALPAESRLVLALKTLCGFDVPEIAQRLFISPENVYKRLGRARRRLGSKRAAASELSPAELGQRLPAIHQVLYALFSEGYLSTQVDYTIRSELCQEAIRLAELVFSHPVGATPETAALLALMHFHLARASARIDGAGGLILLEDQDRSLWDQALIHEGLAWLEKSASGDHYSRFHAEAAIAAEHCLAPSLVQTDWNKIVRQYDLLIASAPSALFELNRAVALAEVQGPALALAALAGLRPPTWLARSYLWLAVQADLHFRSGLAALGEEYLAKANEAAPTPAVRALLNRRFARSTR